jgi:hypothetical protein
MEVMECGDIGMDGKVLIHSFELDKVSSAESGRGNRSYIATFLYQADVKSELSERWFVLNTVAAHRCPGSSIQN